MKTFRKLIAAAALSATVACGEAAPEPTCEEQFVDCLEPVYLSYLNGQTFGRSFIALVSEFAKGRHACKEQYPECAEDEDRIIYMRGIWLDAYHPNDEGED